MQEEHGDSKLNIESQIEKLKQELKVLEPVNKKRNQISALKNRVTIKKKDY